MNLIRCDACEETHCLDDRMIGGVGALPTQWGSLHWTEKAPMPKHLREAREKLGESIEMEVMPPGVLEAIRAGMLQTEESIPFLHKSIHLCPACVAKVVLNVTGKRLEKSVMKLNTTLRLLKTVDNLKIRKVSADPPRIQVDSPYGVMSLEASEEEATAIIKGWLTPEIAELIRAEMEGTEEAAEEVEA